MAERMAVFGKKAEEKPAVIKRPAATINKDPFP